MTPTTQLIKSKTRVRDHGEVFTPDHIVSDMLDLIHHETQRCESRFLEPACGNGNFLVQVLERKLQVVAKKYRQHHFDYQRYALLAATSIYGIDLLPDNITQAQERLLAIVHRHARQILHPQDDDILMQAVRYVLKYNIIQGDVLSLYNDRGQPLVFSEWSFVTPTQIKRKDYIFEKLVTLPPESGSLFDTQTVRWSDRGESVFFPKPIRDYPPCHFLSLRTHDDQSPL